MIKKYFIIFCCIIIVPAICTQYCRGGDLDDDISKYTDDSVSADDALGKKDNNINFIVLDAMAAASRKASKGEQAGEKDISGDITGDKNENSVVVGAGTQTGNIYNIQVMK
ncbi:MAG: hypothetical protein ABIK92_16080 [Pseudomonadota bacterium]